MLKNTLTYTTWLIGIFILAFWLAEGGPHETLWLSATAVILGGAEFKNHIHKLRGMLGSTFIGAGLGWSYGTIWQQWLAFRLTLPNNEGGQDAIVLVELLADAAIYIGQITLLSPVLFIFAFFFIQNFVFPASVPLNKILSVRFYKVSFSYLLALHFSVLVMAAFTAAGVDVAGGVGGVLMLHFVSAIGSAALIALATLLPSNTYEESPHYHVVSLRWFLLAACPVLLAYPWYTGLKLHFKSLGRLGP